MGILVKFFLEYQAGACWHMGGCNDPKDQWGKMHLSAARVLKHFEPQHMAISSN